MVPEDKVLKLLKKYGKRIAIPESYYYSKSRLTDKVYKNATKVFAFGLEKERFLGFVDNTVAGTGKGGIVFTDSYICCKQVANKPIKLWYDEIKEVKFVSGKPKEEGKVEVKMDDGRTVVLENLTVHIHPLYEYLTDISNIEKAAEKRQTPTVVFASKINDDAAIAGGYVAANRQEVNRAFDEEKFHASQGHGFAAERANNLYDNLTGHDAKIVGDNNAKNGADRVVDGVQIQSKYCATGRTCVNECFAEDGKGLFRYLNSDGSPMQIEVPSDKYDDAIKVMQEKIRNGQVPGVKDPNEASSIIRKGHFTYAQARNIAKAGTVESLIYDTVNGAIIATSAFGVTSIITFSVAIWNGQDFETSVKMSLSSGLKVSGASFMTTLLAAQLSKAGLNSALVSSTEAIMNMLGPKASAVLINAFRGGSKSIYGAAAMKSAAKLLRGNIIASVISSVIMNSFDLIDFGRGRISGRQAARNVINTTVSIAGGGVGFLAGAAAGSAVFPVVGTVIGGIVGGVLGGSGLGALSDKVTGKFIQDDADEMTRIIEDAFKALADEYLLNRKEAEKTLDELRTVINQKKLKSMFASKDRNKYARDMLTPIIEKELRRRKHITVPTDDEMFAGLKEMLEEIADAKGVGETQYFEADLQPFFAT